MLLYNTDDASKGPAAQRLGLVEKAKAKLFGPDGPLDEALIRPPDHDQRKCSFEPVIQEGRKEDQEAKIVPERESASLDLPPAELERKPSLVERMKPKVEHLIHHPGAQFNCLIKKLQMIIQSSFVSPNNSKG